MLLRSALVWGAVAREDAVVRKSPGVFGQVDTPAQTPNTPEENTCCSAILLEGGASSAGGGGNTFCLWSGELQYPHIHAKCPAGSLSQGSAQVNSQQE